MAEIPVEKKSNLSWLWWLLLLAGIIALLWAIFDNDDDTPDVLEEDTAIVANDAATDVETVDPCRSPATFRRSTFRTCRSRSRPIWKAATTPISAPRG